MSGQFLSIDEENGQIYLDVTKDIDYDQQIEQRAETLDERRARREPTTSPWSRSSASATTRTSPATASGSTTFPGLTTNADRRGYLFMGAPNERSTAQPPRDFYIYFIQPYDAPRFTDEERADEVFVRLAKPSEEFTDRAAPLRRGDSARPRSPPRPTGPSTRTRPAERCRRWSPGCDRTWRPP